MIKRKIFIIISILFLISISFLYRLYKRSPVEIVKLVLSNITKNTIENDLDNFSDITEYYQERYQKYFTDEAIERSLNNRTFRVFHQLFPEFEGTIVIASTELTTVKSSVDDVEIYGKVVTDYHAGNDFLFSQSWNIKTRLIKENYIWKISYLVIYKE